MIPLDRQEFLDQEPAEFDLMARQKGLAWLGKQGLSPDMKKAPAHWNRFRQQLQGSFEYRCAYLGILIASGEVDHFLPKQQNPFLAWEWSNLRWCESRVNRLKGSGALLDPFDLPVGVLDINPLTMEFFLNEELGEAGRNTLAVLNESELLMARKQMLDSFMLENGEPNLAGMRNGFPLLARAFEKLLAGDEASPHQES